MQQWFHLAVFGLTFGLVVIVILYRLVIGGGSISRGSSGGSHGSIYDGTSGTMDSDCGSSGGGDGGGCGGSG